MQVLMWQFLGDVASVQVSLNWA